MLAFLAPSCDATGPWRELEDVSFCERPFGVFFCGERSGAGTKSTNKYQISQSLVLTKRNTSHPIKKVSPLWTKPYLLKGGGRIRRLSRWSSWVGSSAFEPLWFFFVFTGVGLDFTILDWGTFGTRTTKDTECVHSITQTESTQEPPPSRVTFRLRSGGGDVRIARRWCSRSGSDQVFLGCTDPLFSGFHPLMRQAMTHGSPN